MRSVNIFTRLMICLAFIGMSAFIQQAVADEPRPNAPETVAEAEHQVIVYYFHGNVRCFTCKKIEKLTRDAVTTFFSDEMAAGLVKLRVINVDEKENKHFVKDYQLFTRSVVISHVVNEKEKQWKNLQRVWELVHDDGAFIQYIQDEIKSYLS